MKTNIKKYISGILCLLFLTTGCDLDVRPYDSMDGDNLTANDLEGLTQGIYRLWKNDGGLADNGLRFGMYGGDDLSISGSTTDPMMQILDYRRNVNSSRTEYAYEFCYRISVQCNKIIEFAENLGNSRTPQQTILMGENYYSRALAFFLTVNMFGQQYVNNPTQNPGIVMKLSSDPRDFPEKRSTVAEVYTQIESDLLKAIEYMTIPTDSKEVPKNACYATKEAAEALLARVYLYMERWEDARRLADKVINSGRYKLLTGDDFTKYPQFVPEENSETIFAIRKTLDKDDAGGGQIGSMFCRIDNTGWAEIYASSHYLQLSELHPEDLRNKYIQKQYAEGNAEWFIYTRLRANSNVYYEYVKVSVQKEDNGSYTIVGNNDFDSQTVHVENFNLGKRYYVVEKSTGAKRIGRIERKCIQRNDYPQYWINKFSYQEQRQQLWSYVISRLGEVYLIRAEANAMLGQEQAALDDVNVLRRRAGIPEWTLELMRQAVNNDGTTKTIHDLVLEERQLELAFEGHRRFDVFRRKQTLDKRYPGGHTWGAAETVRLEIPWNDKAVCEFIPRRQYDVYPQKLEQNP